MPRTIMARKHALLVVAVVGVSCANNETLELPPIGDDDSTLILAFENLGGRADQVVAFDVSGDEAPSFAFRTDTIADLSAGVFEETLEELALDAGGLSLNFDGRTLPMGAFHVARVRDSEVEPWRSVGRATGLITSVNIPHEQSSCFRLVPGTRQPAIDIPSGLIVPAVVDRDTVLLVNRFSGVFEAPRDGPARRVEFEGGSPASDHVWAESSSVFWTVDSELGLSRIERNVDGSYDYVDVIPSVGTSTSVAILQMTGGMAEEGVEIFMLTWNGAAEQHTLYWTDETSGAWMAHEFAAPTTAPAFREMDVAWMGPHRALVAPHTLTPFAATVTSDRIETLAIEYTTRRLITVTAAEYDPAFGLMAAGNSLLAVFFDFDGRVLVEAQSRRVKHPVQEFIRLNSNTVFYLTTGAFVGFDLNQNPDETLCDSTMGISDPPVQFMRRVAPREVLMVQQRSRDFVPRVHYMAWEPID